jgi:hypothetical protein
VIVITGPAYLPSCSENDGCIFLLKTIGNFPDLVHVPTHFFKIVLTKRTELSSSNSARHVLGCAAFLVPNSIPNNELTDLPQVDSYFKLCWQYLHSFVVFVFWGTPVEKDYTHPKMGEHQRTRGTNGNTVRSLLPYVVKISDLVI